MFFKLGLPETWTLKILDCKIIVYLGWTRMFEMGFKRAFKWIFINYSVDGHVRASNLEKIAKKQHVNYHRLVKAVIDKGLDLIP